MTTVGYTDLYITGNLVAANLLSVTTTVAISTTILITQSNILINNTVSGIILTVNDPLDTAAATTSYSKRFTLLYPNVNSVTIATSTGHYIMDTSNPFLELAFVPGTGWIQLGNSNAQYASTLNATLQGSTQVTGAGTTSASQIDISGAGDLIVYSQGNPSTNGVAGAWVFRKVVTQPAAAGQSTVTWVEEAALLGTPNLGADNPQQGYSVCMSGNGLYVAIGAPFDGLNEGAAYIFLRNATAMTWSQQQKILFGAGTNTGFYVNLSNDGSRLAICSNTTTSVEIYNRSGVTWTFDSSKLPTGAGSGIGADADFNGANTLCVIGQFDGGAGTPAVNIYTQPPSAGGPFTILQTVVLTGATRYPHVRMSYDGSTIVASTITAGLADGNLFILKLSSGTYTVVATYSTTDFTGLNINTNFGNSLDITNDGLTIAVGAPALAAGLGYIAVFKDTSGAGTLQLVTKLTNTPADLGISTAITGNGNILATVSQGNPLASYVFV